jgi:1-acyl-sn-glycerol-3-phosphate acyltransferase
MTLQRSLRVVVTGLPDPTPEGHFLLLCNHQSWVDIPDLQKLFNRRLPMLRLPVSIVNFVQGTRFRARKHAQQQSPFRHLLKPKAGDTALVLDTLVDVTITYPCRARPAEFRDPA